MDCEICFDKFDHSFNKPMVLIRCGHTVCAKCVNNLAEKKCPSCNMAIKETLVNWAILKIVADSEYDMLKSELEKTMNDIESIENKLIKDKEEKIKANLSHVQTTKKKVEKQANEIIKLINENKVIL